MRALGGLALMAASLTALAGDAPPPNAAETATRESLARIEALNPRLRAVIAVDPEALARARALDRQRRARGPLYGRTVLVKDNIETAGALPTTAGSLALAANVSGRDAPLVARLRAADAIIVGKSNLSEWANIRSTRSVSGWSAIGGQTRNPHVLDRQPCGSSSGSAVAVAAGLAWAAIGTETDGSITCPASVNGVVGLKPTVGLVSRRGIVPISASQDTAGPMTRTVRDAALLLNAMAATDAGDAATAAADAHRVDYVAALAPDALRGQRIGVLRFASGRAPGVDALFEQALAVLREQGAILVDIDASGIDETTLFDAELVVLLTEFKAGLARYLAGTPAAVPVRSLADVIAFNDAHAERELALFGQELFLQAERTAGLDDPAYQHARAESLRLASTAGIDRWLATHDVVAVVQPGDGPAVPIDPVNGDHWPGGSPASSMAAIAGYPHLSVPMGTVRGLPVGLSFIGPAWSEARLLAFGHAFEQAAAPRAEPALRTTIAD